MVTFFGGYALFLAQVFTLGFLLVGIPLLLKSSLKKDDDTEGTLEVVDLKNEYHKHALTLKDKIAPPQDKKETQNRKTERKEVQAKSQSSSRKAKVSPNKKVFVLDFKGDLFASQNKALRKEINSLLYDPTLAPQIQEVVIRLESPGGTAMDYGLGAALIAALKDAGIRVVVCVDLVAASGGYMMACVADQIIAAPHAIVGSIGVVMEAPNFSPLLGKIGIDYHQWTGGKHKRPYSMNLPLTEEGDEHLTHKIEDYHQEFIDFVQGYRPQVSETATTGDHWTAKESLTLGLGLVDHIDTSDTYLRNSSRDFDLYSLSYKEKEKSSFEKMMDWLPQSFARWTRRYL